MSTFLTLIGFLAVVFGIYIGASALRTDIQLGLCATCIIGGFALIGIGSVLWRLSLLDRRLTKAGLD